MRGSKQDNRGSFIFYKSYFEAADKLPAEEFKRFIGALVKYALYGEEPENDDFVTSALLAAVRPSLDRSAKNYENGKKGGRPEKPNETEINQTKPNETESKRSKGYLYYSLSSSSYLNSLNTLSSSTSDEVGGALQMQDAESDGFSKTKKKKQNGDEVGGFETFWEAYPKKNGKKDALKAFGKINPDGKLLQTMLEAIERQKQSDQWQIHSGQFIPLPATWLNGARWEDETVTNTDKAQNQGFSEIIERLKEGENST